MLRRTGSDNYKYITYLVHVLLYYVCCHTFIPQNGMYYKYFIINLALTKLPHIHTACVLCTSLGKTSILVIYTKAVYLVHHIS